MGSVSSVAEASQSLTSIFLSEARLLRALEAPSKASLKLVAKPRLRGAAFVPSLSSLSLGSEMPIDRLLPLAA